MNVICVVVVALLHISNAVSEDCKWHFYQHYEQKGCYPVNGADGCPERFKCIPLTKEDRNTCLHMGKRYHDGDVIDSKDPCDDCICTTAWDSGDAQIECAAVDCPEWETKNKSCRMEYKPDRCCPEEVCEPKKEDLSSNKTCQLNGKTYKLGEDIQMSDPCMTCTCTEKWVGPGGPGCSDIDCKFGLYTRRLRKGCIPIYREKGCCPIEMYCDDIYGATEVQFPAENKDDLCQYHGRYYDRGSTAYLKTDKYQCKSCTCTVPPDFTCLQKTCPPPPKGKCKARYGPCCPTYECE